MDGEVEITVYDYFVRCRKIPLQSSADLPCINVGKPKRPTYIPLEVTIISTHITYKHELYPINLSLINFRSFAPWSLYNGTLSPFLDCKELHWWRNPDRSLQKG